MPHTHTHTHVLPSHLTLPSRLTLEIVTDHHHSVFVLVRRALPKSTLVRVIVPQTRSVRCRKRRREFGARISRSLGRRRPRPRPSPFEDNNLWASVCTSHYRVHGYWQFMGKSRGESSPRADQTAPPQCSGVGTSAEGRGTLLRQRGQRMVPTYGRESQYRSPLHCPIRDYIDVELICVIALSQQVQRRELHGR